MQRKQYLVSGGEKFAENHSTVDVAEIQSRQHEFHEICPVVIVTYVQERTVGLALLQQSGTQEADGSQEEEIVSRKFVGDGRRGEDIGGDLRGSDLAEFVDDVGEQGDKMGGEVLSVEEGEGEGWVEKK